MTDLKKYATAILEHGDAKEVRIYNTPIGLILRAETNQGGYRKEFIDFTKPTMDEMAAIGNDGYLSFKDDKKWFHGDKLRHCNNFNNVFFTKYTSRDCKYFYHEESGMPLMSKHYVKAPEDN